VEKEEEEAAATSMATQFGRKLACELIFSHFGESVQKVCESLVYRGQLSLPEIARYTGMNINQLRNCLLVLIQHNCAQAFKVEHEGVGSAPQRVSTSYIALTDNILHRLRFPKFLVLVKEDVGDQAEALIEGLLEHGRLTLEQLIQRAAARGGKAVGEVATAVKDCFGKLLSNHYVERCPAPEPSLRPKIAVEPPKKTPRGSARGRGASLIAANGAIGEEQRVMSAAAPTDAERFQVPVSLINMGGTDMEMGDTTPIGQKRKREALQMDTKTAAAVDEKEVLWRVNYEEFIRRLRHQVCVAFVRSRVDSVVGTVLEGMLDATRRLETSAKQHSSGTQLQIPQGSLIRCRRNQHILFAHIHQCLHGVVCIVREGL
jgi:DNA-directed RNA polymerase III subunit RPC3